MSVELNTKLLFISVFNYGSIELAKNHVASLKQHGIENYTCFVTDQESVDELTKYNIKCSLLINMDKFGISQDAADFGEGHFNKMSYLRYYVIRDLLNRGFDVWYMDVDTVVLTNLNILYNVVKNNNPQQYDLYFQSDCNSLCTGCALYLNNLTSMHIVNQIISYQMETENDQTILFNLLLRVIPEHEAARIGMFDPSSFPNGMLFFDEDFVKLTKEMHIKFRVEHRLKMRKERVYFVHANWMVGNETKTAAFKKYRLWFFDDTATATV